MIRDNLNHSLYRGMVFHRRLIQPQYQFRYRVFNLLLDIDSVEQLSRKLCLFSYNRFNIFSFYDKDHLPKADRQVARPTLRDWITQGLAEHDIDLKGGPIQLFCYPRVLGFVFNPLSVWYCRDTDGALRAIVCEVRNTFGERHCYLLRTPNNGPIEWSDVHEHPKRFHVSPFLPVSGRYSFRFSKPSDQLDIGIVWSDHGQRAMIATQRMKEVKLTDWNLCKSFVMMPLMTLKVVMAIHWQALKIWIRGGQFHKKPTPPPKEISSDV